MTATQRYRIGVAAFLAILAAVTAVRGIATSATFPLAGGSGLLILAAVAGISAVQDRRWVAAENLVLGIIATGAALVVLGSAVR